MSENEEISPQDKPKFFAVLFGTLLRPKHAFTQLKAHYKKAWWVPALLIIALTIAPQVSANRVSQRQANASLMEQGISRTVTGPEGEMVVIETVEGPPPGAMTEVPTSQPPAILTWLGMAGTALGLPIGWLVWGGGLYLTSVFLGRSSRFRDMFRLTVWAKLPLAIRGLVQTLYITLSGEVIINKGMSGFVYDKASPPFPPPGPGRLALAGVLQQVDLYLIWSLILTSIGLVAFTQLPKGKCRLATVVIWIVLALLAAIPSLVGGMML